MPGFDAEAERHLQEVMRTRSNLRRAENDLAIARRDHTTVSGELVGQRSRARSLEEDSSR